MLRTGTVVDATLISAPSSTKNAEGERDPEMHQVKKGNQWYFGMKAHIGADEASGLVHSVEGTAANVSDISQAHALLHGEEKRAGAYEFIRERLREGRQAYVVCPLVEGSDKLEAKAAAEEANRLRAGEFADFEVGLLHGQMPSRQKQEAMERFAAGGTNVLVATSVIEVGIDVANATVILVEGAER